ncbi:MAG: MarR family transcriptional regulator [Saprospiraceae bacterium]|nr:MarR family transcriptional regulator [Saprospiraceae bacterium]
MRIEEEINQKKFINAYQKAVVNIAFTASWLSKKQADLLKPFGVTIQQFNILRILRGAKKPLTIKILTSRMIDKMSNASRLVDKLKAKGYVERTECSSDRRRVDIVITEKGIQITKQMSTIMDKHFKKDFPLSEKEANILSDLLDKMRENS